VEVSEDESTVEDSDAMDLDLDEAEVSDQAEIIPPTSYLHGNSAAIQMPITPTAPKEKLSNKSQSRKVAKPAKIPKPPNSFILYRKEKQEQVLQNDPDLHCSKVCKFKIFVSDIFYTNDEKRKLSEICGRLRNPRSKLNFSVRRTKRNVNLWKSTLAGNVHLANLQISENAIESPKIPLHTAPLSVTAPWIHLDDQMLNNSGLQIILRQKSSAETIHDCLQSIYVPRLR